MSVKVVKPAVAGTLEEKDVMVTVEPIERGAGVEVELDSIVIKQYGERIKNTVMQVLNEMDITDVHINVVDKGAKDIILKDRIESAVEDAMKK